MACSDCSRASSARVLQAAGGIDGRDHRLQLRQAAAADRLADRGALRFAAVLERVDQGQRRLALGEVIAEVLAALLGIGAVVEHVIHQLVGRAEVAAVGGERAARLRGHVREHGRDLRAGFEQLRGLAVDDLEVALLGGVRVARVHQLQHLALGDDVGGLRHDLHHRLPPEGGHHLEGARVDEITDQHARLVAEHPVGGIAPAAQRGAVDDVIVQQRRGVDELDERRGLDVRLPLRLAGAGGEHDQHRAQALAAAGDDVLGDLVDERHGTLQARADDRIDRAQVRLHQGTDLLSVMTGGRGCAESEAFMGLA